MSAVEDRKSTRLNSSHGYISYAVFCLKKKKKKKIKKTTKKNKIIQTQLKNTNIATCCFVELGTCLKLHLYFFVIHDFFFFFFFNDTATTEIYTLSLHDALPISQAPTACSRTRAAGWCSCATS